jgi:predicted MFS family arabinose efflux permease
LGELVIQAYGYPTFFVSASLFSLGGLLVVGTLKPPEVVPVDSNKREKMLRGNILLPLVISGIFGISIGTLFAFFPPFAKGVGGVERVGGFYIAYACSGIGLRLLGRRWADKWGRWQVVIPALLLYALGMFLLVWPGPLEAQLWVGALTGGAHGLLYPTLAALHVDQVEPGRRGRMLGLFSGALVLGNSVGPMTMGVVAEEIGYYRMFGLTGMLPLVGIFLIVYSLMRQH